MLTLRRSGRVAEGGALLRRYVGEYLHRGFESLLLRFRPEKSARASGASMTTFRGYDSGVPRVCAKPARSVAATDALGWSAHRRGGRAVECGGLENRYPSLGGSRVQIPPPPLYPGKSARACGASMTTFRGYDFGV